MNQLALGLRLKQLGQDAAEENSQSWVSEMRRYARVVSSREGEVSADEVRAYALRIGWHPESPNAFGAIFRPTYKSGKREGWIQMGHKRSEWPSNHGREIRRWRWIPHVTN